MFIDDSLLITLMVVLPFMWFGLIPILKKVGDKILAWIAVVLAAFIALPVFLLLPDVFAADAAAITAAYDWIPSAGLIFSVFLDPIAIFMAVIASGIGLLVVLYSVKYMEGEKGLPRYYALIMLFIGAMIGLVITDNLLVVYFFWEIVGLCSYALISFNVEDPKAAKAGIKAFVTTRVGDVGLAIGIFVLYVAAMDIGATGTQAFSIQWLIANASALPVELVSFAGFMFILGAMGKSAQLPLHAWLPDAMEAPTTVSALIHAATMVNAGIYILARMAPVFVTVDGWGTALLYLGGITALVAAIMAVVEPDLKRLLAYSTVSQLGYMVFAVGLVFEINGVVNLDGVFASMYHLMNHAIFKALLFLCAGAIIHSVGTRNMYEMRGLKNEMPKTRWLMLIGALSLGGIPFLSGFFSKDLIFAGAYEQELWIPLILIVVTAMLTFAYALRMYFLVFEGEGKRKTPAHETPGIMLIVLAILALGAVISWALVDIYSMGFETFNMGTHHHPLADFISHTFTSTAFLLSLCGLGVGVGLYFARNSLKSNKVSKWIIKYGRQGFGFDKFYEDVLVGIKKISIRLRRLQTGDANMNFVGMVIVMLVIFAMLMLQGVF